MSDETVILQERIEKLRDALMVVRDRDPKKDALGGPTHATYVAHTEQMRQHARRALQVDDALTAFKPNTLAAATRL